MFLILITLPLINYILISLFGRFIGYKGVMRLTLVNILISLSCTVTFIIFLYAMDTVYYFDLGCWFAVSEISINFSFILDKLSSIMFMVVLSISYLVHLYSCAYMKSDPHFNRFMSYLSLFTFFMLILVSADNLLVLF